MNDVDEPIVTYSDDWKFKSDEERRRWAFERVGVYLRSDEGIDVVIATAEKIIAWINGDRPAAPPIREAA